MPHNMQAPEVCSLGKNSSTSKQSGNLRLNLEVLGTATAGRHAGVPTRPPWLSPGAGGVHGWKALMAAIMPLRLHRTCWYLSGHKQICSIACNPAWFCVGCTTTS